MTPSIPLNALDRHIKPLLPELQKIASEVISSGYYVLGPNVSAFETEFAAWCGAKACVSVANGTEALELGLRSLGINPESRVALVANAAMYGTTAVLACGATPVFVDIDADTSLMDPLALQALLEHEAIDLVIVTHLYGKLADMDSILKLSERHGFSVFEDCAQAHGATDGKGQKAGTFGHASSFSFYPTKNLGALGDGGAVITNDEAVADELRKLRQYGWSSKYNNTLSGGRNSRLDEIQAGFLRVMLTHAEAWNARRREIANTYSDMIRNDRITLPARCGIEHVAHLYVVRTESRAELQRHLASEGVSSDIHYPIADHHQVIMRERFPNLTLPNTERACDTVLTLPCFPALTDEEVMRVVEACNRW